MTDLSSVDPRAVSYWRVSGLIGAFILWAVFAGPMVPLLFMESEAGTWAFGIVTGLVAVRIGWILLTTRLRFQRLRYRLDEHLLTVQDGVLTHREMVIPISRMQHVDIDRGPVERAMGLASFSVFTAGGRLATLRLSGLTPERAEELRADVLARRGDPHAAGA